MANIDPETATAEEMREYLRAQQTPTTKPTAGPYRWKKEMYHVQVPATDTAEVGDIINVEDNSGGSRQMVLSVTVKKNRNGQPYKVILVEAINGNGS